MLQVGMQRCSCVLINWGASASPAGLLVMMHGNHCSLPALFSHHPSSVPTHPPRRPPPQAEALSLRRALADAQRKLHALSTDSGAMIDRRIVVKMLITYFEKDYSGGCGGRVVQGWVWVGKREQSQLPADEALRCLCAGPHLGGLPSSVLTLSSSPPLLLPLPSPACSRGAGPDAVHAGLHPRGPSQDCGEPAAAGLARNQPGLRRAPARWRPGRGQGLAGRQLGRLPAAAAGCRRGSSRRCGGGCGSGCSARGGGSNIGSSSGSPSAGWRWQQRWHAHNAAAAAASTAGLLVEFLCLCFVTDQVQCAAK